MAYAWAMNEDGVSLALRFPAAHQFLRLRLIEEIFPIAPWLACRAAEGPAGVWTVSLGWPELGYTAAAQFSAEELRAVYGRWSDWARARAFEIADLLPV